MQSESKSCYIANSSWLFHSMLGQGARSNNTYRNFFHPTCVGFPWYVYMSKVTETHSTLNKAPEPTDHVSVAGICTTILKRFPGCDTQARQLRKSAGEVTQPVKVRYRKVLAGTNRDVL
ncbi:hypothetical protein COCON_G00110720 [Conger conger]|uniref:Uncharacterized protein n=1 Tax=Conger conger TaxID=82655 RepID=A0A9Q1DKE6_CONCO|nr:hypothetical protein COCON_G00110720 [Conger conger]